MPHLSPIIRQPDGIWHAQGEVMGGPWQLKYRLPLDSRDHQHAQRIAEAAYQALARIDYLMSPYRSNNDIYRASHAAIGTWTAIDPHTCTVLAKAQDIAAQTNGSLDITLAQAINQWGFGPETQDRSPLSTDRRFELRAQPTAVRRLSHFHFNVCALAKGYAIDHASRTLQEQNIEHFLIEAAGEIWAQGKRTDNRLWKIGLELPVPGKILVYDQLALNRQAIASSGSYRKYHIIDDKTYAHTIDPNTCNPLESDLLAVSVSAADCISADALATALFVMGEKAGSQWAHERHIAALFLSKTTDGIRERRSLQWAAQFSSELLS